MEETKLIITSDAHGNRERLEKVRCLYDASWIFLDCGDSCLAKQDINRMGILSVQGNNDIYCSFPDERVLGRKAGILGHSMTEMKAPCSYFFC